MTEALIIYLYTTILAVKDVAIGIVISSFILLLIGSIHSVIDEETEEMMGFLKKIPKWPIVIIVLILVTVPSKDDLKFIVGGAVAWNGIEAAGDIEGIEKLPKNIIGAVNYFLEDVQGEKKRP